MRIIVLSVCLAGLLTTGCGGGPRFVGREGLAVVDGEALPPPATQDLIIGERGYLIGPLDRVAIEVFGVGEMSRSVQVDASGKITMPLIGVISATGKTPGQLGAEIAERLRAQHIRNPQVTVNLTDTVSQLVTVDGSVTTPGLYPVTGKMTLMRAIAKAEGTTEFARENHVVIFRQVNGQQMAALYDLRGIRLGMYPDPDVYANDVISVGDSNARRLFRDALQASGVLAAPIVALLQ